MRRPLTIIRERPVQTATAVLLAALAVQAAVKRPGDWDIYVLAGRQLVRGEDIYGPATEYAYPPLMALVAIPFSMLPQRLSLAIWFVISALCFVVLIRCAWTIAGGTPVAQFRSWDRRELWAAALGLACGLTYILNVFAHQQTDLMIAALLALGCVSLLKRDGIGGSLIGLAAACKGTPMLWAPYLLLKRRVMAAVLVGAVALGVNLLPDLVASPPEGGPWLQRWVTRFVLPSQRLDLHLGAWSSELIYNQSLGGTLQRLVNTELVKRDRKVEIAPRERVPTLTLKLICYAVLLAMLAISAVLMARAPPIAPSAGLLPPPAAFEFGIVLTLMLLMSPMSSKAHFATLVLPGFCLARRAFHDRDWLIGGLTAAAAFLAVVCNKDPLGAALYDTLLWSGTITACTLLLWLGCVIALARAPRKTAAKAADVPAT